MTNRFYWPHDADGDRFYGAPHKSRNAHAQGGGFANRVPGEASEA